MTLTTGAFRRRAAGWVMVALGSVFLGSFFSACDDRLIGLTTFFDPCGTLLNCPPGSFESNAGEVGDWCIDPACVVPGACSEDPPLGTVRDICP